MAEVLQGPDIGPLVRQHIACRVAAEGCRLIGISRHARRSSERRNCRCRDEKRFVTMISRNGLERTGASIRRDAAEQRKRRVLTPDSQSNVW